MRSMVDAGTAWLPHDSIHGAESVDSAPPPPPSAVPLHRFAGEDDYAA
jgi:hypothetical protein